MTKKQEKLYEKIKKMDYSEFCLWYDGEEDNTDKCEIVLEYDDFMVYEIAGCYFYLEGGEYDASDFYEVECVAELTYDINNDIKLKDGEELSSLFDCICCGERVEDDCIKYLWFGELNG